MGLTAAQVAAARRAVAAGATIQAVADELGAHRVTLTKAVYGITWRHVTSPPPVPRPRRDGNPKLRPEQVEEIRRSTQTAAVLAGRYGVTREAIYHIRNRQSWRPLTTCRIPGCARQASQASGTVLCPSHLWRYRRYGDPLATRP